MARAGVPNWIAGPVSSAYLAARRVRVDGALGEPWQPTSGILPGCAMAVFVLRLMLVPWEREVGRADDSIARR
eukprot:3341963-Lingulodinium_polyedra.AAC.1